MALRAHRQALALDAARLDQRIKELEASRKRRADCPIGVRRHRPLTVAATVLSGAAAAAVAPALFAPPLSGAGLEKDGSSSEVCQEKLKFQVVAAHEEPDCDAVKVERDRTTSMGRFVYQNSARTFVYQRDDDGTQYRGFGTQSALMAPPSRSIEIRAPVWRSDGPPRASDGALSVLRSTQDGETVGHVAAACCRR